MLEGLALLSLAALLLVILLSCLTSLNVGFLAIALAWLVGMIAGVQPNQIIAGFPSNLFLTLVGVTFLFTQAEVNGTLERIAMLITRLAGGNAGWVVVLFFFLSALLSSAGAGALSTAALAAPLAMGAAHRSGISPFLMAIMVGNGANAGNISPISPIGVIVAQTLNQLGLQDQNWHLYFNQLFAHIIISAIVMAALGGWSIWKTRVQAEAHITIEWRWQHGLTIATIAALMAAVLIFKIPVGLGAFAAGAFLTVARVAQDSVVIAKMPWAVILMVSGMSVLIAMLERTGGLDLFSAAIARFSTTATVTGVVAFVSGIVSAYSSTSGVVLPAFLPMASKLAAQLPGTDVIGIISSINLGSHLVDVSPMSTIGAMCIAASSSEVDRIRLFRQLMIWGLSMSVVGAVASLILFGGRLL